MTGAKSRNTGPRQKAKEQVRNRDDRIISIQDRRELTEISGNQQNQQEIEGRIGG